MRVRLYAVFKVKKFIIPILSIVLFGCNRETIKTEYLIDDIERIGCVSIPKKYQILKNERVDFPKHGGDYTIFFELKFAPDEAKQLIEQIKNNICGYIDILDSNDTINPLEMEEDSTWVHNKGIYYFKLKSDDLYQFRFEESTCIFTYSLIHH